MTSICLLLYCGMFVCVQTLYETYACKRRHWHSASMRHLFANGERVCPVIHAATWRPLGQRQGKECSGEEPYTHRHGIVPMLDWVTHCNLKAGPRRCVGHLLLQHHSWVSFLIFWCMTQPSCAVDCRPGTQHMHGHVAQRVYYCNLVRPQAPRGFRSCWVRGQEDACNPPLRRALQPTHRAVGRCVGPRRSHEMGCFRRMLWSRLLRGALRPASPHIELDSWLHAVR